MRTAFVTFEYPPLIIGGAGVYAFNITHELARLGHQVIVFTPEVLGDERSVTDNLEFRKVKLNGSLPFRALQFWLLLPKLMKQVNSEKKIDIIHFNGISYWFLIAKILNVPHVVTIHHLVKSAIEKNKMNLFSRIKNLGTENNLFISSIEKKCIKSSDRIIAVSKFTKDEIINVYGTSDNKIKVIYNGIDFNGYDFSKKDLDIVRNQFNVGDRKIILFVGRINDPRKGLDFMLNVFKEVLKKQDAVLIIVGKGDQTKARNQAKSLGILENIVFTGFVDEDSLKKYYCLCNVYVCPSKLEGFGLTIVEAMAAGKPIVATNVGAISEIIVDKKYGILVEPNDIYCMSKSICLILQNEILAYDLGDTERNLIKNKFSWINNAKKVEKLYLQLVGK